ncbi:hypothetical protein SDC9_86211 [bioreactor metagenome]|uniref:Uncharacterized protein n=1 Tax=bioreactor metagenome TaxID=1076179 RepID=A0A644ZFT4_9ZZZZ
MSDYKIRTLPAPDVLTDEVGRGSGPAPPASAPTPPCTASPGSEPREPLGRLGQDLGAFAEREPHQGPCPGRVGVEDRARHRDDPAQVGQPPAEVDRVVVAQRGDVGGDEVGALGGVDRHPGRHQAGQQDVVLGLHPSAQPGEPLVGQGQPLGHRPLERCAVHVREELLGRRHRGHQLGGRAHPADLPARDGEGLAGRGDLEGPLRHPGQRRQRDVRPAAEEQVLVHLVGDHHQVVLHCDPGDRVELVGAEDVTGRIVRRVDQQQPGPVRDRRPQVGLGQPVAGFGRRRVPQPDRPGHRPGQCDRRGVGVVRRLEHHHLVAGVAQRQDRGGQRLGRPGGDQHLGRRVVRQAVPAALMLGDRLPQRRDAAPRWVLVVTGPDRPRRRLKHLDGPVGVREALSEVDRSRPRGQRAHRREDRRPERAQPRHQG